MQRALEQDPNYAPLFVPIARLAAPMSVEQLTQRTVETMRSAARAEVALTTASSVRQSLPPGVVTLEDLRAALPYDNEIVVVEMSGEQLRKLLDANSAEEALVTTKIEPDATKLYRLAVTDYLANVAARYRDFFASLSKRRTALRVRNEVRISFAP
jgi:2',3'-cyclic-nucleotide 2'-phosphodiesterase (5'-nucleotidase family)